MQQFYGKGCGFIGSNAPSVKGSGRVSEAMKRRLKPIHKFAKDVVDLSKKAYLMRRFIAEDGTKVGYPSWPKESDCKSAGRSPSGVRIPLPPPFSTPFLDGNEVALIWSSVDLAGPVDFGVSGSCDFVPVGNPPR